MKSPEAEVRKTLKYLQHLGLLPKTSHKASQVCVRVCVCVCVSEALP